jgi:hypothetical protein
MATAEAPGPIEAAPCRPVVHALVEGRTEVPVGRLLAHPAQRAASLTGGTPQLGLDKQVHHGPPGVNAGNSRRGSCGQQRRES